jgi:hypothetical protein
MCKYFWLLTVCPLFVGCGESDVDSPLELGKKHFHSGNFEQAVATLTEAINHNPADVEAFVFRGRAKLCLGSENAGTAIADFNEAIRLDPNNFEAYYQRAIAHRERGNRKLAALDEQKARQLDPIAAKFSRRTGTAPLEGEEEAEDEFADLPELAELPGKSNTPILDSEPEFDEDGNLVERDQSAMDVVDAEGFPLEGELPLPGRSARSNATNGESTPRESRSSLNSENDTVAEQSDRSSGESPRVGSFTEELFSGRPRDESSRGGALGAGGLTRGNTPPPLADWRSTATPPASPLSPGEQSFRKPSPVGTLPFGNPYSSRVNSPLGQADPNFNPYLPNQPRSTGFGPSRAYRNSGGAGGYNSGYSPYNSPVVPRVEAPIR